MQGGGDALAALPNVGLASMSGQRIVFPHATPEYFGDFAAQATALGARIVGGCCGTTPAQIEAIRAAVDEERRATAPFLVRERRDGDTAIGARLGRRSSRGLSARARSSSASSSTRRSAANQRKR